MASRKQSFLATASMASVNVQATQNDEALLDDSHAADNSHDIEQKEWVANSNERQQRSVMQEADRIEQEAESAREAEETGALHVAFTESLAGHWRAHHHGLEQQRVHKKAAVSELHQTVEYQAFQHADLTHDGSIVLSVQHIHNMLNGFMGLKLDHAEIAVATARLTDIRDTIRIKSSYGHAPLHAPAHAPAGHFGFEGFYELCEERKVQVWASRRINNPRHYSSRLVCRLFRVSFREAEK